MCEQAKFLEVYGQLKKSNQLIRKKIEEASGHEKNDAPLKALNSYEEALVCIRDTNAMLLPLPEQIDAVKQEWHDACIIMSRLRSDRKVVKLHLERLRRQPEVVLQTAAETTQVRSSGAVAKTYKDIIDGLRRAMAKQSNGGYFATHLLAKVKLYKIQSNGAVHTFEHEATMSLLKCTASGGRLYLGGIYFLQCLIPGDEQVAGTESIWIYPLIPLVTLCYRSNDGAFLFPDLEGGESGGAFGIMLTASALEQNEQPIAEMEQLFLELLEIVLSGSVQELGHGSLKIRFRKLPAADSSEEEVEYVEEKPEYMESVAMSYQNFVLCKDSRRSSILPVTRTAAPSSARRIQMAGAQSNEAAGKPPSHIATTSTTLHPFLPSSALQISRCLVKSTDKAVSKFITAGAKSNEVVGKLMSHIGAEPSVLTEAPTTSSSARDSLKIAKKFTGDAAEASEWMASKVAAASQQCGRYVVPHIKIYGIKWLEKGFNYNSSDAEDSLEGALILAAGVIEGFSTANEGMSLFAKLLTESLRDNSIKLIERKYGPAAGAMADDLCTIVDNSFKVSKNIGCMQPAAVVKQLAIHSLVDEYRSMLREKPEFVVPAMLLYPDMSGLDGYNDGT